MTSMAQVKEIRERSGAPMNECKMALDECNGNIDLALEVLQKKGVMRAEAKAVRTASEGLITCYTHGGKIGVMLEVNTETDFVARSDDFKQFCEETSLQIAAMSPRYITADEVPQEETDKQLEIYTEQVRAEKKPETAWAKIAAGKLAKWYGEICLLEQESVIHPKKTIDGLRVELIGKVGENVQIRRFARWEVGEGIRKDPKENYAVEVARLTGGQ